MLASFCGLKITRRMRAFATLFLLLATVYSAAQTEYQRATLSVSVPVKLKTVKESVSTLQGARSETKEETTFIQINANLDNMKVQDRHFSGVSIVKFPVYDEIVSFQGTFSKDKSKIETLSLEYQFVKVHLPDRSKAHLEETKRGSFRFTNIPKNYSGYKFDSEQSKITKAEWKYFYFVEYPGLKETTKTTLISLNPEAITKYTNCISLRLRPSTYVPEASSFDKVAVMTNIGDRFQGDSLDFAGPTKGIMALLIHEFTQVPGLKVLEREELQHLLDEIALSESGLVAPDSRVASDRLLEEDILVVIHLNKTLLDEDGNINGWLIQPLIVEKATGEVVDPKLTVRFNKESFSLDQMNFMAFNIYNYVMNRYFNHL